jgi:YegS/Rv2252/BmrU family lipid kinase
MRSKEELTGAIANCGPAVLVVNARARKGRVLADRAARLLREHGVGLRKTILVTDPALLGTALDQALELAPDLVVVGGGDGTLSAAGKRLAHLDVALGVLPIGTTNNFARGLGLPLDLADAVATIATGRVVDVDLGRVGTELFTNLVSLGVSTEVAEHVPHLLKRFLGRLAYPLTALSVLPSHRPFRAHVTTFDADVEFTTHQLNIANGAFHAGQRIARDASVDDHLLVAYRLGTDSRARLIASVLRHAATGSRRRLSEDAFLTATELRLETEPALSLDVDGEVLGTTPAYIAIVPNALRVVAPTDFVDT